MSETKAMSDLLKEHERIKAAAIPEANGMGAAMKELAAKLAAPPADAPPLAEPKEKLPPHNTWQRWLITSMKYNGTVEVIYGNNLIQEIVYTGCDMDAAQRQTYKAGLPPTASQIAEFREKYPGVKMQWVKFETDLEQFIRDYPIYRNTHLVRERWPKMKNEEQWLANRAVKHFRRYVERKQVGWPEYKPKLPDTWLKEKQYLNDWTKQE